MVKKFRRSMWQARYNDAARRSVLPVWENDSIPILSTATESFAAARIEDLSVRPLTADGEPVSLGVIRGACGNTKKYIDTDKTTFLTYGELFKFTDNEIAPPLALVFNPCAPYLIASFDAGSFSVQDEHFKVAMILYYSCGVQHATQLRYGIYREFGHESLQASLAGRETAFSMRVVSDIPRHVFKGTAAFWQTRHEVVEGIHKQFTEMAGHFPTATFADYTINTLCPITKLEMTEEYDPQNDAEWRDYHSSSERRFLRAGFIKGRNKWIDTQAAYGTLLGLWFSLAEIENFKACQYRDRLYLQLIIGARAKRLRDAFAYVWKASRL